MAAILLLDNKDSFVWNLAQALMGLGATVEVRRSDICTVADIRTAAPDALVLSPGPGRPEQAGICVEAVRALCGELPILGVCLGHQAIGTAFGGTIVRSLPCHGKAWEVQHEAQGLFAGMCRPLSACRYHSLVIEKTSLPSVLEIHAKTAAGEVMAVRHRQHPTYGLQFHPESFRTPDGHLLLSNFLRTLA